jgi:CRISPR/Cas system-associated exonuclease Cas4 (RecB family)
MIAERIAERIVSTQKVYKPAGFRASEAGHLCPRYHYHSRVNWDARPTPDATLAHIFRLGQAIEEYVVALLRDAGIQVVKAQVAAYERASDIVGHVDGFAVIGGEEVPIEIKSVSEWTWQNLRSFGDILASQKPYVLRWAAQLPLYLYLHERHRGLWLLLNKQTGELREIEVRLEDAWPLLERVDAVLREAREAISRGEPPAPKPDSVAFCGSCWCRQVGLCPGAAPAEPSVSEIASDPEIAEAAATVAELRDAAKRYESAQKRLKEALAKVQVAPGQRVELLIGSVPVRVSAYETTRYDVPEEVRRQYATRVVQQRVEVL